MSIVVVGGHDRMHGEYRTVCRKLGHSVKVYTQMPARFEKTIGKPDGIVVFTGTVSHKMVNVAVKEAKRKKIPVMRSHSSSASALAELLKKLGEDGCAVCSNY